ncbi:unnamed protein product [Owenia fusiformis]|uniref:Uncharacterized protein n=1 Tax=Owenia fusiformis TaxID=6347 RepID=A0A8J1XXW8_OWEFU|nr:unnamed protein product [Owenia fusiformis]
MSGNLTSIPPRHEIIEVAKKQLMATKSASPPSLDCDPKVVNRPPSSDSPSYSSVTANNNDKWITAGPKGRHSPVPERPNSSPRRTLTTNKGQNRIKLTGVKEVKFTLVYVSNIRKDFNVSDDDIRSAIVDHAKDKGIRVMKADIVHNRVCDDKVGCKLNIPESQAEIILATNFWPDPEIGCRVWQRRSTQRSNYNSQRGSNFKHIPVITGHYSHSHGRSYDTYELGRDSNGYYNNNRYGETIDEDERHLAV